MELKCAFCGKTHTDPDNYTACVIECRNLAHERELLEKRKKSETEAAEIEKQIEFHHNEELRLTQELYKIKPKANVNNWIIKMVWPEWI